MKALFRASVRVWLGGAVILGGSILVALVVGGGCSSLVQRAAFYPQRGGPLPADALPPGVRHLEIATVDGETLEAYFLRHATSDRIAIYFHGNAGNIAQRLSELTRLAEQGVNVLGVGYRGYGASTGRPSEQGVYRDGEAALVCARDELGFAPERTFLFGRSIGTTVAIHTGADRPLAGLILVTPLTTGADFGRAHGGGMMAWAAGSSFDNLAAIARLRAPVLVIHGTDDEVIPFEQGRRIFDALDGPKELVVIAGGRHNSLEHQNPARYWGSIRQFLASPGPTTAGR